MFLVCNFEYPAAHRVPGGPTGIQILFPVRDDDRDDDYLGYIRRRTYILVKGGFPTRKRFCSKVKSRKNNHKSGYPVVVQAGEW